MSQLILLRCKKHNREQGLLFHLHQYAENAQGQRAVRYLTAEGDEIVRSPWEASKRPFKAGLYCHHCLNEGNREALPIDEADLDELGFGDAPVIFLTSNVFDPTAFVDELRTSAASSIRYVRELPAIEAATVDSTLLNSLHPQLSAAIQAEILGEHQLYRFQKEAIEYALAGKDTVVTTPTASGKSLTYTVPIFEALLRDPGATAIYLSPLEALTTDQLDSITRLDRSKTDWRSKSERFQINRYCRNLTFGAQQIGVARYDGAVPKGKRPSIREKQPRYVLTTPDMLHSGMLPYALNEKLWAYFFRGLRYVVIDEMHTYRGVLGAGFANLMRRLRRICAEAGSNPQFLCASATIADPEYAVSRLIGRTPVVINGDKAGAPQRKRQMVIWSEGPGIDARALSTQAKNVVLTLLEKQVRSITFARSIGEINDIYRFVKAELKENKQEEIQVEPFMRELTQENKRRIIRDLKAGRIHAVISTTALSMGIDIGSLSAAVIAGFPGSIAQFWQQAGRAGRSGEGLIILIAASNPLDQFFANHPETLFDLAAEPLYCNPDNPYIVKGHLLLACRELPLSKSEIHDFGATANHIFEQLVDEGVLVENPDCNTYELSALAQESFQAISFRNLSFAIDVFTEEDRKLIVTIDAERAQRALHKYAHYQNFDRYYEVKKFDVDFAQQRGEILVEELENPEYTTTAQLERQLRILDQERNQKISRLQVWYGIAECRTEVHGYYKVPLFARNEPFQFQPLGQAAPPPIEYHTQSVWFLFQSSIFDEHDPAERAAGLYSLAGALQLATAVEELCDPSDIEAVGVELHPDTGCPTIILYDVTPGGVGISESAYGKIQRIWQRARLILVDCPYCSEHPESRGCPFCVTAQYGDDSTINRSLAISIMEDCNIRF